MGSFKPWPLFCAPIGMLGDKALPLLYHCVCEIKAKDKGEMKKNILTLETAS